MKAKEEKPVMWPLYNPKQVGEQLNAKTPFFTMKGGGVYAVELAGERQKDGSVKPVPNNFRRVDKSRALAGRQRRLLRKAERRKREGQQGNV